MTTRYLSTIAILFLMLSSACEKGDTLSDCGENRIEENVIDASKFFSQPSEIYWGVTGNKRTYTYNWTLANICAKRNPWVGFVVNLNKDNTLLTSPFSFNAAITTCFGVQAQTAALNPHAPADIYASADYEIGMNQCFGSQASANIYPYLSISFTTLGSSHEDSLYLIAWVKSIKAKWQYSLPK